MAGGATSETIPEELRKLRRLVDDRENTCEALLSL